MSPSTGGGITVWGAVVGAVSNPSRGCWLCLGKEGGKCPPTRCRRYCLAARASRAGPGGNLGKSWSSNLDQAKHGRIREKRATPIRRNASVPNAHIKVSMPWDIHLGSSRG
ncbi:hypothetical protein GQ53DRAFT_364906 [Thozetella sp. PMI_491]|nr:hypothetical protein GQ53DRAFT_364906 [Thozetella sp. PMI_491]